MKKFLLFLMVIIAFNCKATNDSDTITTDEMNSIVSFLASDELQGRDTGSEGIETAGNYIEDYFKTIGVKPYYDTYRDSYKIKDIDAFNVIGVLEGHDPVLKNEVVILGAHFDHIGYRVKPFEGDSIGNGANDDASGTATVMALAKRLAKLNNNKRTVMFALYSGEEMGLLGSKHLAERLKSENCNLYTMLNFEMLGVPFTDNRDYDVFLTGYDLSNMAAKINDYVGFNFAGKSDVAVKYNLFKRSDNYAFYETFNLPCQTISSCDLTNYDFYHHADDEADKMDYVHMANVVNQLVPAIVAIANSETKEIKMNDE
jgi:Zn-dependent M28 family amino/carboxypeptidase